MEKEADLQRDNLLITACKRSLTRETLAASVKRHDTADIDQVKTEKRETNFDR